MITTLDIIKLKEDQDRKRKAVKQAINAARKSIIGQFPPNQRTALLSAFDTIENVISSKT